MRVKLNSSVLSFSHKLQLLVSMFQLYSNLSQIIIIISRLFFQLYGIGTANCGWSTVMAFHIYVKQGHRGGVKPVMESDKLLMFHAFSNGRTHRQKQKLWRWHIELHTSWMGHYWFRKVTTKAFQTYRPLGQNTPNRSKNMHKYSTLSEACQ